MAWPEPGVRVSYEEIKLHLLPPSVYSSIPSDGPVAQA
jgi:hypothetical protein